MRFFEKLVVAYFFWATLYVAISHSSIVKIYILGRMHVWSLRGCFVFICCVVRCFMLFISHPELLNSKSCWQNSYFWENTTYPDVSTLIVCDLLVRQSSLVASLAGLSAAVPEITIKPGILVTVWISSGSRYCSFKVIINPSLLADGK